MLTGQLVECFAVTTSRVVSPRVAVSALFLLNGAVLASWAPRIPAVKADLDLSDPDLGIALFGVALGSVPTLFATGRILRRVQASTVCRISALVFISALPLLGLADGLVELTLALVVLGAASGALDVAMNTAAGGDGLALLAAVVRALPDSTRPATKAAAVTVADQDRPTTLRLLVPLAVSALLLEGILLDWCAVLASQAPVDSPSAAAVIVAAFSAAMTLSRSAAGWAIRAFGEPMVVFWASVILLLVVPTVVLQPSAVLLVCGVVIAGLAIGPLFPIVMSAAGARSPHDPATATARVTAGGYLAYLAGPPMVGFLAGAFGLSMALALVAVLAAAVLLFLGRTGLAPH